MIIHFGKNPIKGGNPPRERKLINKEILIIGFKFKINNWLIKNIFNILKEKHIIKIKNEYINK